MQPERQLKAFERITLEPGETRMVTFLFDDIDLSIVNDKMQWATEGQHEFLIGSSSQDIRLTGTIPIRELENTDLHIKGTGRED